MGFRCELSLNLSIKSLSKVSVASLVCVSVLALAGCVSSSISESSDSLSASVNSSSKSFTSSSGESKEAYLRDIRQYTVIYTQSKPDLAGFSKGLSRISEKYGVTNWESYSGTYYGIGEGFAKAGISQAQFRIYLDTLAKGDSLKVEAIQQGFNKSY